MFPTPKQLAEALAQTSLSEEQKKEVRESIPYLNKQKVEDLYEKLLSLKKVEQSFVRDSKRIDLKYKMKLEEAMKQDS